MDETLQLLAEIAGKYERGTPEYDAAVSELARRLPSSKVQEDIRTGLATACHQDTPEGFEAFYELLYGFRLPVNTGKRWVASIFKAHDEGKGFTLNGFRGSWKSVTLSVTFQCWRIGMEPHKTNVTISANDDSAEKITKSIAAIIEYHPEWKRAFPDIVPETSKWSVDGYWVIDTSISREEWARKQAGVIDPSFVGGGYKSTRINGKHPTGCLVVDDIHDLNNSTSEKERVAVVKAMTTVIMKTVIRRDDKMKTWFMNIGVPWALDDCHHILKNSGGFIHSTVPAMVRVPEGEGVYIDGVNKETGKVYEDLVGWWRLTEPAIFGVNSIMADRALGKFDFWQMIMMDLTTAKTAGIKYYTYYTETEPDRDVIRTYPAHGGADPAFTLTANNENSTSSFALAQGVKRPGRGGVLLGGVVEKCTLAQSTNHLAVSQKIFPNWRFTAVENVGMGLMYIQYARKANPNLLIVDSDLGGIRMKGEKAAKAKNKKTRIQYEASSWIEDGTWLIADRGQTEADDEFLKTIRDALDNFNDLPNDDTPDKRLDALDAFYHLIKAAPELLFRKTSEERIPTHAPRVRQISPLAGIGVRGYGR